MPMPPLFWEDTDERKLVVNGTLAAVFQVDTLEAAQELLDMVVATGSDGQPRMTVSHQREATATKESLSLLNFDDGFIYIKIHTAETIKHLDSSRFQDIWIDLKGQPKSSAAVVDFLRTYPVKPPSFSKCSFIVMYNRGESLRRADLSKRFENFASARPKLLALRSNVMELEELCFHGDILPHNVAIDDDGNLALFDYDEAHWLASYPPQRLIPDQANIFRRLSYPNVLRKKRKKEYSSIQFSLIVRFVAEALDCSPILLERMTTLCSMHEVLADMLDSSSILNDQVPGEILRQVRSIVAVVDSMLTDDGEEKPSEDDGEGMTATES